MVIRFWILSACLAVLAALLPLAAVAQDGEKAQAPAPSHAMTMHGEPKYGPDFDHLDYVNPEAPKGGTLRQHAVGSFDSVNPFIIKGTPAAGLNFLGQNYLYDSLMEQSYDEPFSMYCLLCETVERDPDNLWVAFNLRGEAKWHDGEPITAQDVVYSFNTFMEHGTPFFQAYYGDVKEVRAEEPGRVVFEFKHADNAELPLILGQMSVIPKHYWEKEEHDFTASSLKAPLVSGAYEIESVDPGRRIVYKRFADYWGKDLPINKGRFNFDRIEYDYYRDANVALEAFFAGEYDYRMENTAKLWATAYDAPPVQDGRIVKAEIPHQRPQGMQGFLYNIRRPVFADKAVREALGYAFDFEWSNKQLAYGSYTRTESYFANSELASSGLPEGRELEILERYRGRIPEAVFTQEFEVPESDGSGNNRRNLRKAMQILDEAGWVAGEDGIRAKDGVKLEFEILYHSPLFEKWVLPFIRNLERIGVKANYRVVDSAQYQNRMESFDYDMTIGGFGQSSSPGNEQRDFWSSAKADMPGSRNYIGIKDAAIDELIEELIQAESREDLVAHVRALDRILLWGHYVIPHWYIDHWRIAWWDKLQKPETLSPLSPAISTTWWAEEAEGE